MKKLAFFIGILCFQASTAQQMLGIANGNFAGTAGMQLNPAAMLYMPYKWDLNIINVNVSFENDYLSYSADKTIPKTDGTTPDGHGGLVDDNSPVAKSAYIHAMLKTPSFVFKNQKMAFGFHTAVRNDLSVQEVPERLAKYLYEGKDYAPLFGKSIDVSGMHGGALSWAEIGLSAGKVVREEEDNTLLLAATFKYIHAIQGTYFRVNSGSVNIVNDSIMYPDNFNADYNNSAPENFAQLLSYPPGRGFGLDLGLVYVSKPFRGNENTNAANNKRYNYRVGISLLDLGLVSFTRNASAYHYNLRATNLIQVRNVDSLIEAGLLANKFMMGLPAAISLQYDHCLAPRWYVNVTAVQRIPMLMAQVDRPNNLSSSIRYEANSIEVGLPFSLYDYSIMRVGFALRYKFLFIGTDKLGTFVHIKDDLISGADFYWGLRLNSFNFRKKPKTRKPCVAFF